MTLFIIAVWLVIAMTLAIEPLIGNPEGLLMLASGADAGVTYTGHQQTKVTARRLIRA